MVALLGVHTHPIPWTFSQLGEELGVSASRVHDSLKRCARADLYEPTERRVKARNLEQFLVSGVRYAFPAALGANALGIPTGAFAPPLRDVLSSAGAPYVWPHVGPESIKGQSVVPLHPSVPSIALRNRRLYELLAIVDSLRLGGSRERSAAQSALEERLRAPRGG
ncbi:MAG: hypothetical protein KDD82_16750 [Planctomycetes bacterium]|nr:hypothetical protein [Planctomycetota bacterium]